MYADFKCPTCGGKVLKKILEKTKAYYEVNYTCLKCKASYTIHSWILH